MTQLKQQYGSFRVIEHKENFQGTIERGTFEGTVYWSQDMAKIIEAVGIWKDSPKDILIKDLSVDEKVSGNNKINCLFY